jgi:hypothetical protein
MVNGYVKYADKNEQDSGCNMTTKLGHIDVRPTCWMRQYPEHNQLNARF